jgi:crotonobetainyl-CoA:carnitine CoA-transferase CaiB-like acyl-CoA transferase
VELERHPYTVPKGAAPRGAHTDEVKAEADALLASGAPAAAAPATSAPAASVPATSSAPADNSKKRGPLDGVTVLDLGLAVAGPFGTQVLAQLGARVIKVTTPRDKFWFSNHIAMCCNRDKESITLNLKDPEAVSVLHKLVEQADVVQHNMRYDAAERLGVDYESLKQVNPKLIYCHTLGHEQGPRAADPGNDQTGGALAGTTWLDGGLDNGGRPIWSVTSLGDTGNGYLSALGIIQALYDRDRTGEGQFVRTSILYAQLLNASMSWVTPDGKTKGRRPSLDSEGYGWNALYRLYQTAEGWLCVAALTQDQFEKLARAAGKPGLAADERFADATGRSAHDGELAAELAEAFLARPAATWFAELDAAGVPAEVSDRDYALRLFADPAAQERGWTAEFQHRTVGKMKLAGLTFDLSGTPGAVSSGPLWPGQNTKPILSSLGYADDEITRLLESKAADDTSEA